MTCPFNASRVYFISIPPTDFFHACPSCMCRLILPPPFPCLSNLMPAPKQKFLCPSSQVINHSYLHYTVSSQVLLRTLENCSTFTSSLISAFFASFSGFAGIFTLPSPSTVHPHTSVTYFLVASSLRPSHDSKCARSTSRKVWQTNRTIRWRKRSSKPAMSAIRSAQRSSPSMLAQKRAYSAPSSWEFKARSLVRASWSSPVEAVVGLMRWRARENWDEGNWAMALTRMLVTISSLIRSGFSWYLFSKRFHVLA